MSGLRVRRALLPNAVAGAVICLALVVSLATTQAAPAPAAPGRAAVAVAVAAKQLRTTAVGVGLREYRIALYRSRVLPGRVRLNIENLGEDGHDLRVIGPTGTRTIRASSPELKPGTRRTLTVTLRKRGVYTLVCTLADHEARGMLSRLRVVKTL
jgi:plastocyanin